MSSAVINSTALVQLASIGQFRLLHDSFDEVRIPPAVWRELVDGSRHRSCTQAMKEAAAEGWLRVVAPGDGDLVGALARELPDGDAEAIALAVQEKPDAVLLDRASLIGLLIQAKQRGRVAVLKDFTVRLRRAAGLSSEDELDRDALAAVGEA